MQKEEKGLPPLRRLRPKGLLAVLIGGALGILLLVIGGLGGGDGRMEDAEESEAYPENAELAMAEYERALENKIAALCEGVRGVSGVRVAVTLERGYEFVYAKDAEARSENGQTLGVYRYVTVGSGSSERVVCLSERPPQIAGVGIVCRGGGDARIQKELSELIAAAFDVSFSDVYIAEGGG